ncbi:hypothetical protein ASE12_02570 [Aeromicrobium sp. Root236]|uniref:cyclophilin-like fold protein n=1 Tax=Aeromicrobium sp. Root236 TaxID=1736498 RepID=UPI0006FFA043|nr:cyclophilin-like fold protein [Aeromicrobium sp. Root236]KRC66822.1 hypothetical protein ASE12_02570 [Aeromicrobium sp. Root236]
MAALIVVLLAATTVACGDSEGPGTGAPSPRPSDTTRTGVPHAKAATPGGSDTEENMRIRITIGEQRLTGTLEDSAAADDLLGQLPLTIDMTDHDGVEKTGPLPSALSLKGQPEGADPDVGAIGYYAPGRDLVLYYGDQSYFDGIVVLGSLDGDAAERIAELDGAVTATIEAG